MNEKLIAGYAAFTTAEEVGAAAVGKGPASTPFLTIAIGTFGVSAGMSYYSHC